MKTSLFDFDLPEDRIALHPVSPRDAARMLVVDEALQDKQVRDLPQFLRAGDVMVFNDTRVIPARLLGRRGEVKIELLLHKRRYDLPGLQWQCFAKPGKRLKPGDRVYFAHDFFAEVTEKLPTGEVLVLFGDSEPLMREKLLRYGRMPLPPYIERQAESADQADYQTVYARHEGSVAAPTAGLHFTPELLAAIDALGVKRVFVTLHVGGGTFLPVKAEDTDEHVMHSEWAEVSAEAAAAVNEVRRQGGRVVAVGTTSLRTLESAADESGALKPFQGETDIFITPGYRFRLVDRLLTNFHLPCSTLYMLVCAFSGKERMDKAYNHAISNGYRFYSYGDACWLANS